MANGASQTISGIPTGRVCSVTETAPAAIAGYTWATPVYTPATIPIATNAGTFEIVVTNSISRDMGFFKITKVFDPLTSGFTGTFSVVYKCGTADAQTVILAAGVTSAALGPFATGTSCAVTEPVLPTAPTGWTFGTPVVETSPVTIVKNLATDVLPVITVTNSISQDMGFFKITKSTTNPDEASLPAAFTGTYDCGTGYTGDWSVASGASQTISGVPTGSVCSVSEDALAAIAGYSWAAPVYSPATVTIDTNAGTFEIGVTNSISRDVGSFKVTKSTTNPDGATLPATFTGTYDCGTGYTGSWSVADGASQTISGIPTGNTCSVSETAPAAIDGYSWAAPVYTPATVTIDTNAGTFEIVVTNSISKDQDRGSFKVTKSTTNPDGATLPAAFTGTYDCGTGYTGDWSVANGGSQTIEGIPTGNTCSVTEDALATIDGYTWATPVYSQETITISTKARTFEIVVTNSISRDRGRLPNAGTTVPLAGLLAAIGLVSAGLILMGASRFNRRGRKS